jgi:hypothetical protein
MNKTDKVRKLLVTCLGTGLLVLILATFGLFATGASAAPSVQVAPNKADVVIVTTTTTPQATRTPPPIRLRPWVQFGHGQPGSRVHYRQLLFNHLSTQTDVNLRGGSRGGWPVAVHPTTTLAIPGYANIITVTVGVPMTPEHRIDLERTRAVIGGANPFTTTAYLITITRRHSFTDLPQGHWADDPVQYLVDQGVISGYADGSFHPNENVTRAQFAKMLVTAMGWPLQTPPTPSFSDVPADFWAYGYIETAIAHGVISGYTDGTFRPSANVTRAQVAKMVFTALNWRMESPTIGNFSDVNPGDWTYNFVQAVSSAQVMAGYGDHSFRPNAPATRAQIAKILALSLFSDPNN